ncbi:MAG: type I glyceraldehyde-3-phosphate dehydrogenase [Coriobacteriia bacterium]|nr:type I glyceraldehyde-3-phosphate dehydrogenase [Coriobacteriia bacterium]
MAIKLGINGFGRIGRNVFRAAFDDPDVEVVAVNDLTDSKTLAHLLKYDSVHGAFGHRVEATEEGFAVDGKPVKVLAQRNPADLTWGEEGVELVVESTGFFTDANAAHAHIDAGATRVIISAPAKNEDITIVMGVNDDQYDPDKHFVVSNASCTTNCLAPFAKVLRDTFGLKQGFMNTIHSFTNDQCILDVPHKDLRRARAAGLSIIPTSTGAAKAIGLVLPDMKGKLDGMSMRVPTPDGSVVDLVAELETPATKEEINAAMQAAAQGPMKGILEYCTDPIVSVDVIDNPASSIYDAQQTMVMGGGSGTFVKCISWYDNEWGYSNRVIDLAKLMCA